MHVLEPLAAKLLDLDPAGQAFQGMGIVQRYCKVVGRQQQLIFSTRDYDIALANLHFFLIAIDRVADGLAEVGKALGGDIELLVASRNFDDYRDARNHFEHLEDRLFGTKRNAPQPITENGATRTVHFGLYPSAKQFRWGAKIVDISDTVVIDLLAHVRSVVALIEAHA